MFECKGCGAYLRFDIASQRLKCDYCNLEYDVDEAEQVRMAKSDEPSSVDGIEVYSFECPQCSGTIYGDRQDMTGFCRYCGTPVELAGRLTTIEHPSTVIPFKKTKDECKKIFKNMVSKNPYIPAGFKDEKHIDSFRGIYMPYYLYHVDYDGDFKAKAKGGSRRKGDYIYTDEYSVEGSVSGTYEGFEHDSSTTFNDEISEAIGPFMTGERIDFKAGYLSGFYADASDENTTLYQNSARKAGNSRLHSSISSLVKKQNSSVSLNNKKYIKDDIVKVRAEKAMYPVWFMSYRNGDRVAYAAVNGQTGKITADLPIDFKKFLLTSFLTAIPLFVFLNLFSFLVPSIMLIIYSIFAVVSTVMFYVQISKIKRHEGIGSTDKKDKGREGALFNKLGILIGFAVFIIGIIALLILFLHPVSDVWYYAGCLMILCLVLAQLLIIVKNHNYLATRKPVQFNKEGGDNRA